MLSHQARRTVRGLAGTGFLFIPTFTFLVAKIAAAMTCDDTCSPDPGREWSRYADSPQWAMIGWLGWAMLLSAVACAVATRLGRRAFAGTALSPYGVGYQRSFV